MNTASQSLPGLLAAIIVIFFEKEGGAILEQLNKLDTEGSRQEFSCLTLPYFRTD